MSLCPLTEAHILQARVARLLEQAKRPHEAHDADIMARHIEQIAAAEDAAADARLASEEAEIDAWEARYLRNSCRDMIAAAEVSAARDGRRFQSNGDA